MIKGIQAKIFVPVLLICTLFILGCTTPAIPETNTAELPIDLIIIGVIAIVAILIVVLIIVVLLSRGKKSTQKLFDKKRQAMEELKVAERKFLKRQISEDSYKKVLKKKQEELIKIDAALSEKQTKQKGNFKKELVSVEAKEKHRIEALLKQKQPLQAELEVAQKKYLKRQIDEKTYKSLLQANQSKIIELEGKIKSMKSTKDVKDVFAEIKRKVRDIEMEQQKVEQRETERIAKEILEQMQKSAPRTF